MSFSEVLSAGGGDETHRDRIRRSGRLAQLVRAPALQAGGRRFESCTAHHSTKYAGFSSHCTPCLRRINGPAFRAVHHKNGNTSSTSRPQLWNGTSKASDGSAVLRRNMT